MRNKGYSLSLKWIITSHAFDVLMISQFCSNDRQARELTILSTTWFGSWYGTHIINLSTYDVLSLWILKPRKATQKNNTKFSIQQFPFRTFWSNFCLCLICDVNEHGCQHSGLKIYFALQFYLRVTYVPLSNTFIANILWLNEFQLMLAWACKFSKVVIHSNQSLLIMDLKIKRYQ